MERPRINIANVIPRDIKLFEQVFDLELRIQNPNDTPLEINGLPSNWNSTTSDSLRGFKSKLDD
jgi:hypothetical protein